MVFKKIFSNLLFSDFLSTYSSDSFSEASSQLCIAVIDRITSMNLERGNIIFCGLSLTISLLVSFYLAGERVRDIGNTSKVEADEAGTTVAKYWGSDLAMVVDLAEISELSKAQNSKRLQLWN